jgi:hypothetical protein
MMSQSLENKPSTIRRLSDTKSLPGPANLRRYAGYRTANGVPALPGPHGRRALNVAMPGATRHDHDDLSTAGWP